MTHVRLIALCAMLSTTLLTAAYAVTTPPSTTPDDLAYPRGIYRDFAEFKRKTPSVELSYKVKERGRSYPSAIDPFSLLVTRDQGRELGAVCAFSDGDRIHYTPDCGSRSWHLTKKTEFFPLKQIGTHYAYFVGVNCTRVQLPNWREDGFGAMAKKCAPSYSVLDLETGALSAVETRRQLRTLLATEPALLEEYNAAKTKLGRMEHYIDKYVVAMEARKQSETAHGPK